MDNSFVKIIINAIAIFSLFAGALGMLFCLPFLFSSKIEDIVGSGLPFIAGAILFGSGLLTLAINNRRKK